MRALAALSITLSMVVVFLVAWTQAERGEEDKACTEYGSCVIVAPTEDSCPAYTGNVVPIGDGRGVVCFPG